MNKITLYYFSGTGNSLHVARGIAKYLPDLEMIPIISLSSLEEIKTESEIVGFVFPIHLSTIPIFILDFIKKIDFSNTSYIFAAASRAGTQHSAFYQIDKILKTKGKKLNAAASFNLPSNDPKFSFKALTPEEDAANEKNLQQEIILFTDRIKNKQDLMEEDQKYTIKVPLVKALFGLVKLLDGLSQQFYTDNKCTGCQVCAEVCPAGKIIMRDGKPLWQKDIKCLKCYACLNFCPHQAVQIKGYTEGKGRYSHPFATKEDIAAQKCFRK